MIKILPLPSAITANMSTSSTGIFKGQEMGLRGGGAGPGAGANHGRASIQRSEVQVSQAGSKRSRKRRSAPGDLSSGPVGSGQAVGGVGGPATKRRLKQRRRKRANSNAVAPISRAPFNSTQFLMSDHQRGGEDSALEYLDVALGPVGSRASSERVEAAALAVAKRKATRPRESSFSLDSDDDYYYSSPEDEEEFVCQEFIKEYNSVRTRSLVDMPKADLIKEYLQMEQRVDNLERRVDRHRGKQPPDDSSSSTSTSSNSSGPPNVATVVEQIKQFQREIHRLETENEKLRATNSALLHHSTKQTDHIKPAGEDESGSDSDCSTCSSSSSSSSGSSSDSGSDSESEDEAENGDNEVAEAGEETNETEETEPEVESRRVPQQGQAGSIAADQVKRKEGETDKETDTGYESSNSGSNKSSLKKNELISSTTNSV